MKYRSRIQIAAEILESIISITAAGDHVTNTKIMYKAYLSYTQLKEYLDLLMRNELIKCQEKERAFIITDKGKYLLELYYKLNEFMSIKQIMVSSVIL